MDTKRCGKCGEEKPTGAFRTDSRYRDSLFSYCDACEKAYNRQYYSKNKEKLKQQTSQYYAQNRTEVRSRIASHRAENKAQLNKKEREYKASRLKMDPIYRLKTCLRSRLNCALKNNQKSGSAVRDLGSSIEEFKIYIESKFQPGMSWDNWGRYGWHIDHIVPLDSFDLTDLEQVKAACHYTNLQPLWAEENLSKSNKVL